MSKPNIYSKFIELKDEILKHKWIESEKVGKDIGFENALTDWMHKHRRGWCDERMNYEFDKKRVS